MESTPPARAYGVVVVLHQPAPEDLDRLVGTARSALPTASRLVVVDNTPEAVPGLSESLDPLGPDVVVVHNANRGGLGGAYNVAAREILRDPAARGFFLLDQDSELPADYFEALAAHCAPLDGRPFVVGPRVFESTMQIHMAHRPPPDRGAAAPLPPGVALDPVEFVISSGSLVSAEAFAAIGPFAEDLFIESIDLEYCLRGWARGVPSYVDPAVSLAQRTGNVRRTASGFAFDYSATRYYYRVRNYLWVLRLHLPRAEAWRRAGPFTLQQMRLVAREEQDRRAKLLAMTDGVRDGWRGRLGPRPVRE